MIEVKYNLKTYYIFSVYIQIQNVKITFLIGNEKSLTETRGNRGRRKGKRKNVSTTI